MTLLVCLCCLVLLVVCVWDFVCCFGTVVRCADLLIVVCYVCLRFVRWVLLVVVGNFVWSV